MTTEFKDWDSYFINMARFVARKSKDPSTQVGSVAVGPDNEVRSTGYNGFPRGIDEKDQSRWERPIKYSYVEHAERNLIYNAARVGISLAGCTIYTEVPPCTECSKAIIQAGIVKVVTTENNPLKGRLKWGGDLEFGFNLLVEAGIEVVWSDA